MYKSKKSNKFATKCRLRKEKESIGRLVGGQKNWSKDFWRWRTRGVRRKFMW